MYTHVQYNRPEVANEKLILHNILFNYKPREQGFALWVLAGVLNLKYKIRRILIQLNIEKFKQSLPVPHQMKLMLVTISTKFRIAIRLNSFFT